jgi:hypothetical protein
MPNDVDESMMGAPLGMSVECPTHQKVCLSTPANGSLRYRCPQWDCTFQIVMTVDMKKALFQANWLINNIRCSLQQRDTDQLDLPVCPLCATNMIWNGRGDWNCKTCKFTLSNGYLERFKSARLADPENPVNAAAAPTLDLIRGRVSGQIVGSLIDLRTEEREILIDILQEALLTNAYETIVTLLIMNPSAVRDIIQLRAQERARQLAQTTRSIDFEE